MANIGRILRRRIGSVGLLLVAHASAASAQEYCVSCTEPNATYRCVITDARPGLSQSLQLVCLQALARDGQHTACSVKRGVTVFDCDAPVKRVSAGPPDAAPLAATTPPAGSAAAPASGPVVVAPAPPAAPDLNAPPKTLVEAAQRAKVASDTQWKQSGDKMKSAGDATTGFFKKTFECLGSLFTRCGSAAP